MAEETKDPSFWDSAGDLFLGFAGAYGNAYLTQEFGQQTTRAAAPEPYVQAEQVQSGPVVGATPAAQAGVGNSPLVWIALAATVFYLVNK